MQTQAPDIFWTKSLGDWELLDRYRTSGSQTAFAELVARHVGLVYGICRRRVVDPDLAGVRARQVFVALAGRGPRRRAERALSGWLVQTTLDACADAPPPPPPTPPRGESTLDAALASLSREDLDLLLARYYHGWNLLQLSQAFGMSQNNTAKRVSRATARLRRQLASRGMIFPDDGGAVVAHLSRLDHEPVGRGIVAGIRAAIRETLVAPAPAPQPSLLSRLAMILSGWSSKRAAA
jgi:DNA-directed RNA polymerase specialized sigma24 family protein